MSKISALVIEDSVSEEGVRLTTLQLSYPRYIHSELMTHRVFSRNASSSRAIPVSKLASMALENMVEPIRYGLNQAGMQAKNDCLTGEALDKARAIWKHMAETCAAGAVELAELGLHKQWANRPLEWFSNIKVIVTATEWSNFYALRAHPDAQPEFHTLAVLMKAAMEASMPKLLSPSGWHLPYVTAEERSGERDGMMLAKLSAARCARVSYLKHDGAAPSVEEDLALYDRLVGGKPIHASPIEHQATPDYASLSGEGWERQRLHGNFVGWRQYRKLVEQQFNQPQGAIA